MAFDISLSLKLSAVDDASQRFWWPDQLIEATTTGDNGGGPRYQTVGAAATEAVELGDITMGGLWLIWNTHATDTIDVQDAAGNHFASLLPQGFPLILPSAAALVMTLDNAGANPITVMHMGFDA